MKTDIDFTKIPNSLNVDVQKGDTGVLIAEIGELGILTEANDLNELFINVNDVIYTYFDIPKKYQNKICFVPTTSAREHLVDIANETSKKHTLSHVKINTYYTDDLCRHILSA